MLNVYDIAVINGNRGDWSTQPAEAVRANFGE